jgi:hypothetical protein
MLLKLCTLSLLTASVNPPKSLRYACQNPKTLFQGELYLPYTFLSVFDVLERFFAYLEAMPWGLDQNLPTYIGYISQSTSISIQGELCSFYPLLSALIFVGAFLPI